MTTEIKVDEVEIAEAYWWHLQRAAELFLPPITSMSGRLIARFIEEVNGA